MLVGRASTSPDSATGCHSAWAGAFEDALWRAGRRAGRPGHQGNRQSCPVRRSHGHKAKDINAGAWLRPALCPLFLQSTQCVCLSVGTQEPQGTLRGGGRRGREAGGKGRKGQEEEGEKLRALLQKALTILPTNTPDLLPPPDSHRVPPRKTGGGGGSTFPIKGSSYTSQEKQR